MNETLARIFEPRSIAVVGASAEPAKRGNLILRTLAESGYAGAVYPVNPRGGEILGRTVVPSVEALPEGVDLAVLCTPASAAPDLVRGLGRRGVAGAVVLAVGFGESGDEGRALEAALLDAAADAEVRLIGPNTSGYLNLTEGVNLVGARGVRTGGLAVLVQSGNMALALMTEVTERSWDGISVYLGVGNEIDVGFADGLAYLADHDGTHAVIVHAEGFRDAGAFLETASRASRTKPVVALKAGRTARGAEAALSHTGAVAGPYERLSAGLAQAGVVEVHRGDELLHVAETLGRQPVPSPGSGIAILSDGGGQGTMAVDLIVESGARLAELSDETRTSLRALLGPAAAVGNPVDLAGAADGDPSVFGRATELLAADPDVGSVLVIGLFGGYGIRFDAGLAEGEHLAAERMAEATRDGGRGLVVHTMYALHRSEPLAVLGGRGVPVVGSLEVACRCVVELHRRSAWLEREPWAYRAPPRGEGSRGLEVSGGGETAGGPRPRRALTEPEARAALNAAGLSFDPAAVVRSADEAADAWRELGGRIVVKLVSAEITHKSDVGGVVLGVESEAEARAAFERVTAAGRPVSGGGGGGPVEGHSESSEPAALVTLMLEPARAELLVGGYRDAALGPVVTVGAGGVWVEALADASVRVLPVSDAEIDRMLDGLRLARVLAAGRGRPAVDRAPIRAALHAVARVLVERPEVVEVEVNPLFVYDDRVSPVDARIVVEG